MDFEEILRAALRADASDVVLKVGTPPGVRIHGDLLPLPDAEPLTADDMQAAADVVLDDYHRRRFANDLQADLAYETAELGRFRVNVFRQRGQLSMVIRVIQAHIRSVTELNLPPVVERIANERRGLILVTGTTGSGKSTTLAAMLDYINASRHSHIITIEDPIEYTHRDQLCYVNQREVGYDAVNFPSALKAAMRENPDIILVGEMRDLETIETAIMAAETGHLVLSTLHTLDAPETITRVISAFPEHQRDQVRQILASILKGIVSQRLLPRADGIRHGAGRGGVGLHGARAGIHRRQGQVTRSARGHRPGLHHLRDADLRPVADVAVEEQPHHPGRSAGQRHEPRRLRAQAARHRLYQ